MSFSPVEGTAKAGDTTRIDESGNDSTGDKLNNLKTEYCRFCRGPCFVNEQYVKGVLQDCSGVVWHLCLRVSIVLLLFFVFLYIQALFILSAEKANFVTNPAPLVDRLQQATASIADTLSISYANSIIGALCFCFSIRIFVLRPPVYALQMLIRYVLIMGLLYLIRGIFIGVTVMPSPRQGCISFAAQKSHFDAITFVFKGYMGIEITCTDLIISGHTMFVTVVGMLFMHNCYSMALNLASSAFILIIYFILVVSRNHYTVDVLFGVLFAIVSYTNYCLLLDRYAKICRAKYEHVNLATAYSASSDGIVNETPAKCDSRAHLIAASIKPSREHEDRDDGKSLSFNGKQYEKVAMDLTFSSTDCNNNDGIALWEQINHEELNAVPEGSVVTIEMSAVTSCLNEEEKSQKTSQTKHKIYHCMTNNRDNIHGITRRPDLDRTVRIDGQSKCCQVMHKHYFIDAMAQFIGFFEAIDLRIKTATCILHLIAHEGGTRLRNQANLLERIHWMDSLLGVSEYRTNKSSLYFGHPKLYTKAWRNAYFALLEWYGKKR